MKTFLKIFSLLFITTSIAQTSIQESVNDDSGQPIPGAKHHCLFGTTQGANL